MASAPSGTVTFLFTDIEGSTRLWEEQPERMQAALGRHDALLREVIVSHGGYVFKTMGDAFYSAFADPRSALAAALQAQRALATDAALGSDGERLRVRMALHTGAAEQRDGDYFGPPLNRVARLLSLANGGQVLVSEATYALVRDSLPSGVELRDLGEHRLKDLTRPEHVFQLAAPDLPGKFPPLKTLPRTNLPVQPSPLVGRERELAEAGALLRSHRLLTLTGPGGSGKTRLSLQLAAEAADDFPDGVFWVPLQAVRDPAIVERTIAAAIGADTGRAEHLADKRLLLLLDNFEQIVEAAPTVSALLATTPHVKVLVTSREPLHLESEQRYPVEPLPEQDAATLFTERARAVAPGFQPTPAVVEICRRLDGLPLAIELAAARVTLLEPEQLLVRLQRRLPLLASRSRDAPERQRTLRATIGWSYELLAAEEQRLFRRLSVFAGSFTLEAAEAVCEADLDSVESLVEKSLLRRWGSGRLGMLDTIREYATERLEESEEAQEVRRRHAEFFLEVFRGANLDVGKLSGGRQRYDIAIAEQDNIRAALMWALRTGEIGIGLEIALAMDFFWTTHDPREGMRWYSALFEHPEAEALPPELRAPALRSYGSTASLRARWGRRSGSTSAALPSSTRSATGVVVPRSCSGWARRRCGRASSSARGNSSRRATRFMRELMTRGPGAGRWRRRRQCSARLPGMAATSTVRTN